MGHPQFHGRVDRGLVGDALAGNGYGVGFAGWWHPSQFFLKLYIQFGLSLCASRSILSQSGSEPFSAIPQKLLCPASSSPTLKFPKQCGNTWGSYGSGKKPGWLDRGGGRGSVHNSSLFSWFRACMFVSSVNFRSFRGGRADARGFCL